jgi:RNA polymerase sigma-70 factor (ECF subfamily)
MPNSLLTSPTPESAAAESAPGGDLASNQALHADLEQLLVLARPRLLGITRRVGIPADASDDIVQEAFIAAWRGLAQLRDTHRFDAWLDGICRNLCRAHLRSQRLREQHQVSLASEAALGERCEAGEIGSRDIPDPAAFDPAEELSRQDLEILLDRALGYLPTQARQTLEICYLAELPQREAALRLGLTISALEARLHRARRQLRQVLSGTLRADAEAFGLMRDQAIPAGWRESREWCMFCGRYRLHGIFKPYSTGSIDLHMRCPACAQYYSGGIHLLSPGGGLHSFRPAIKRLIWQAADFFNTALAHDGKQLCLDCQAPIQMQVRTADSLADPSLPGILRQHFLLIYDCPNCGLNIAIVFAACWAHPTVQQFTTRYPRWVMEPDALESYAGQPAIRMRLIDFLSAARLTIFADPHTLQVLATFEE